MPNEIDSFLSASSKEVNSACTKCKNFSIGY